MNCKVTVNWPKIPGRSHNLWLASIARYLVLDAESEEEACQRIENMWAGKEGGAQPHYTTAEATTEKVFELR